MACQTFASFVKRFFVVVKFNNTVGGGPDTNVYLRGKLKVFVFDLIFDKKSFFFGEKNCFTPINKNFVFLKKKMFLLFLKKKCFFWKCFFQNFQNFSAHKKFVKNFFEFFRKNISKKTKFLFIGVNKIFSPKKTFFCQKLSVR